MLVFQIGFKYKIKVEIKYRLKFEGGGLNALLYQMFELRQGMLFRISFFLANQIFDRSIDGFGR